MGLVAQGNDMTLDSMTIGVSQAGVQQYLEELKVECFDTAKKDLQEVAAIQSALDKNWQGHAKDVFIGQFNESIETVTNALNTEYNTLTAQINNVMSDYFSVDNSLMGN